MGLQVWFPSMPWEDHCLGHCTDPVSISAEEAPGGRDRWEPRAVALRTWLQIRPALRQASLSLYPEWAYRQHSLGIQFTWISETLGCWWKTPVSFHCPSQCLCPLLKTKKKGRYVALNFFLNTGEGEQEAQCSFWGAYQPGIQCSDCQCVFRHPYPLLEQTCQPD